MLSKINNALCLCRDRDTNHESHRPEWELEAVYNSDLVLCRQNVGEVEHR